ncbi:uncharacterized protein LOC132560231 [Ylistrum balloti]|uniref:uncharacterized protein LOC132560231 n=1 Tax=Ylistrum balloti TaxID=509963 RepID=UPI002905B923|nr:uncharacterized protein LOC132560231 [Ylistrum balloti]
METESSGKRTGHGICGPEVRKDPLSLLTLVDMALALETQKPSEKDHTYAVAKKHTKTKKFPHAENEMLLQKEKDHNYSFCSKSVALRHNHLQKPKPQKTEREYPTRSSSEENLSNATFPTLSESSITQRRTAVDDTSLNTSHKCFPFGKNRSPFHTTNDHTYPLCVALDSRKHHGKGTMSDAMEIQGVKGEPMAMDDSYLGSHSWPKENMFPPFRGRDNNLSHTLPLNYKYDHTYAQGKNSDDEKMSICDDSECQNPAVEKSAALKTDHNYNKGPCDKTKNLSGLVGHIRAPKLMLKNNRIDHNYSGFTGTFSSAPTQSQGSVESLDMDFSQSDTDSCEETEEEERRLAITSTISAWLQLRKDHPYSSI